MCHILICTCTDYSAKKLLLLLIFFTHSSGCGKFSMSTRNTWVPTPITTALTPVHRHFTALHSSQWDKLTINPVWIELSLLAPGCEVINDMSPSLTHTHTYSTVHLILSIVRCSERSRICVVQTLMEPKLLNVIFSCDQGFCSRYLKTIHISSPV